MQVYIDNVCRLHIVRGMNNAINKVSTLQAEAKKHSDNLNVRQALVGYMLHLSHDPEDYAGATQEAAYDLELGDEVEFKAALRKMAA